MTPMWRFSVTTRLCLFCAARRNSRFRVLLLPSLGLQLLSSHAAASLQQLRQQLLDYSSSTGTRLDARLWRP